MNIQPSTTYKLLNIMGRTIKTHLKYIENLIILALPKKSESEDEIKVEIIEPMKNKEANRAIM